MLSRISDYFLQGVFVGLGASVVAFLSWSALRQHEIETGILFQMKMESQAIKMTLEHVAQDAGHLKGRLQVLEDREIDKFVKKIQEPESENGSSLVPDEPYSEEVPIHEPLDYHKQYMEQSPMQRLEIQQMRLPRKTSP